MPGNADKHAPVLNFLCRARRIHVLEYCKYAAVFEQDTGLSWLHCDLVSNGVVQLWNSCHRSLFHPKKGQVPPNAIASGKPFGK